MTKQETKLIVLDAEGKRKKPEVRNHGIKVYQSRLNGGGGYLTCGSNDLLGFFAGFVEGRSDSPAENLGGFAAADDVVVVGRDHQFVGDDFRPVIAATDGNSGMESAGKIG